MSYCRTPYDGKIDFLRSHNREWAVGILNVGSVIQWVHARRWFRTNLTVRIHRGIAYVSAFDAGSFCVGIPMTKVSPAKRYL